MSSTFTYVVSIDGLDVAGMTLAGASITYGTTATGQPPTPTTAHLELLSPDVSPDLAEEFPGISWNGGIPTGYVDTFRDTYEGAASALEVGTSVNIRVATESGYSDTFQPSYRFGFSSTRFTGQITAIDYTPGLVGITAVDLAESLNRVELDPASWPEESETARVERILNAAGHGLARAQLIGSSSTVIRAGSYSSPATAWEHLYRLALSCGSVVWVNRSGSLMYRTAGEIPDLTYVAPPDSTLVDPLQMSSELGDIVTDLEIKYGADAVLTETSDAMTTFGRRDKRMEVELKNSSDVQAFANRQLARRSTARWHMDRVSVHLGLADEDATIAQLLTVDVDDVLELPYLLPASPVTTYSSRVIGYTERLDPYEWLITYALDPYGWDAP